MAAINDFNVWVYDIPIVAVGIDLDFEIWQNDVPWEDIDESAGTDVRRRADIF